MVRGPFAHLSQLRAKISALAGEQRRIIRSLLRERGPLIRGSFVRQKRSCGRPACRCARGGLHDAALLSISEEGRMRSQHVPRADRPRVEAAAGRYREFRRGRAEVVKLGTELVHQLDAFQRTLTEPYPPAGRQTKPRRPSGRSGE